MRAFALPCMICIAFVLSPLPILAQSHRFDMGPAGSPLAAGFQAVDPDTLYSAAQRFGWLTPPTASISRSGASSQFALHEANFPLALIEDATASGVMDLDGQPAPFSFQLDAAPGRYWCFAYLGDLGDPSQEILTPLEGMSIRVNGVTRVEEAFAQLLLDKASHW